MNKIIINQRKLQVNKNQQKNKYHFNQDDAFLLFYMHKKGKNCARRILNYFVGIANNRENKINVSHETIAHEIGMSRSQVLRTCEKLRKMKAFVVQHNYNKSTKNPDNPLGQLINTYIINPILFDMNFRNAISSVIPNAKYLPIALLVFSYSNSMFEEYNFFDKENTLTCEQKDATQRFNYKVYKTKLRSSRVYARGDLALGNLKNLEIDKTLKEKLAINDKSVLYDNTFFRKRVLSAGKLLNMSFAGMCSASLFADHVIDRALKEIRFYKVAIRKAYGVFLTKCNAISREMNIPIKHGDAFKMAEVCNVSLKESPSTLEGVPEILAYKKSYLPKQPSVSVLRTKKYTIEELRAKNPSLTILDVEYLATGKCKIRHHFDENWRKTTQAERDLWTQRTKDMFVGNKAMSVEPPLESFGDPNFPAQKIYHEDNGILHLPFKHNTGCKLCSKMLS